MQYIGVDYHREYSYMAAMNENGMILQEGRVANRQEAVNQFIRELPVGEKSAVLEAGRNWTVMHDWLEEEVEAVHLAHPLKVKWIAESKIKTDKIDARVLAHLLRCDLLPEAYVPTKEARVVRNFLRQRMFWVRLRTMVKNRICGILDRYPEMRASWKGSDLFGVSGQEWLKGLELPKAERDLLDGELELLSALNKRIDATEKEVSEISKEDERVKHLMTIPGIGKFFAVLLAYEIDAVERFANEKKLAAYAGLVPSTYSSGGRTLHGHITKQGNKYLRWALVEAVWPAVRKDASLRIFYERHKERKGSNCAKVATAKRLLTIVYRILKEKRDYELRTV